MAPPGELTQSTNYDFEFVNVEKPYETYTGANVRLRWVCTLLLGTGICHLIWGTAIVHVTLANVCATCLEIIIFVAP